MDYQHLKPNVRKGDIMKKIIPIFITILIVIIVLVFPKSPKENLKNFDKENDETVKDIELVTSEDITYDKFTNLIGKNVSNVHINLGPNSYLRNRPSEEIIKRENLQKYINIQESLAKRVEKRYLDNLSYEVISNSVNGEEECKTFEITTYYYSLYLTDLINLTNELASYNDTEIASPSIFDNTISDPKVELETVPFIPSWKLGSVESQMATKTLSDATTAQFNKMVEENNKSHGRTR